MIRAVTAAFAVLLLPVMFVPPLARAETGIDNNIAWMLNCQGCHRANGGATGDQVPALRGAVAKFLTVAGGREYLIRVPGVSMSPLNDASVASLTNWMLYEFDPENVPANFSGYTANEVRKLRRAPYSSEAGTVRARLIDRIEQLKLPSPPMRGLDKH